MQVFIHHLSHHELAIQDSAGLGKSLKHAEELRIYVHTFKELILLFSTIGNPDPKNIVSCSDLLSAAYFLSGLN